MAKGQKFIINESFGDGKIRLSKKSFDTIREWIEEEQSFWSELTSLNHGGNVHNTINDYRNFFSQILSHLNNWEADPENEDKKNEFINILRNFYNNDQHLHSSDARSEFIKLLTEEEGPIAGGAALHSALGRNPDLRDTNQINGVLRWKIYELGIDPKGVKASKNALDKLAKDLSGLAKESLDKIAKEQTTLENAKEYHTKTTKVISKWLNRKSNQYQNKLNKETEDAIEELALTKTKYEEFMKLKAPSNYWRVKRKLHAKISDRYWALVFLYFVLAIIPLGVFIDSQAAELLKIEEENFLIIAPLGIFLASMVIWLGRILVKLLLSEKHLGQSAHEKSILIMTYLALIEGGGVTDKERELVLASIFSQTNNGLIKDDTTPNWSIASMIAKNNS